MTPSPLERLYESNEIDDTQLFCGLFLPASLFDVFQISFSNSTSKGTDRLNSFQFAPRALQELSLASAKCINGTYRFAPYLEVLKTKGRDKNPRLIGIPTIRDRVILAQLNRFLAAVYPERVPRNVASKYVRTIADDLQTRTGRSTWICSTDIKTFYDSIERPRLLKHLTKQIKCGAALKLVRHALLTPTVPQNTHRSRHSEYREETGVPQGLAISNILASIYMQPVDDAMQTYGVHYYRYVDDVLMYGNHSKVQSAFKSLAGRLKRRGLGLHPLNSNKTQIVKLGSPFGYLGYFFKEEIITVRDSTVERFLHSIAAKFSDFKHNKFRRLEKFRYLTEARLCEIFLMELNERITGAVRGQKRYGWIAYFNQINDLSLLHRLDHSIRALFTRLPEFNNQAPVGLKSLRRAYWEMRFNTTGGYIRNYDEIKTKTQKLEFLQHRGRIADDEILTDEQIDARYERYVHNVLSAMHADEGAVYG